MEQQNVLLEILSLFEGFIQKVMAFWKLKADNIRLK